MYFEESIRLPRTAFKSVPSYAQFFVCNDSEEASTDNNGKNRRR